jgi:hypothetical protein
MRAMTSFDAPGANPTIQRIGFEGNAGAGSGFSAAMPAVAQYHDSASHATFIGASARIAAFTTGTRPIVYFSAPGATGNLKHATRKNATTPRPNPEEARSRMRENHPMAAKALPQGAHA